MGLWARVATAGLLATAGVCLGETVGQQIVREEPGMGDVRFHVLLDFERESDGVFVKGEAGEVRPTTQRAHTGLGAIELVGGVGRLKVNLGSLMEGRSFPGRWGWVGAYFLADGEATVTAEYVRQGKVLVKNAVKLVPGAWEKVLVDVAQTGSPMVDPVGWMGSADGLAFAVEAADGVRVWCDDVLLIGNRRVIIDGGKEGLSVIRSGYGFIVGTGGRTAVRLPGENDPAAVKLVEGNVAAAVFEGPGGQRTYCYAGGRMIRDGKQVVEVTGEQKRYAEGQSYPARVLVDEEEGRLDRTTEGDADNDGFNEQRGAYQVKGSGGKVTVTLEPRGRAVLRPVLEVSGMSAGEAEVEVEGERVKNVARWGDGRIVAVLPIDLQRRTVVEVRARGD